MGLQCRVEVVPLALACPSGYGHHLAMAMPVPVPRPVPGLHWKSAQCARRPRPLQWSFVGAIARPQPGLASASLHSKPSIPRPVVILPGLGNNSKDYDSLSATLEARGIKTTVTQVSRPDWLRNAAGIFSKRYWAGTLEPRPFLDWYFERMSIAIYKAKMASQGNGKISLIGHSAGGWLARVFMSEFGTDDIALLVTLGTPHLPPPKGVEGVIDQTRGLLDYVEATCPGAFFAPKVKYICVAGRYMKGSRFFKAAASKVITAGIGTVSSDKVVMGTKEGFLESAGNGSIVEMGEVVSASPSFQARLVGQGYKQVCGRSDVWGDGVVPEISSHLDGALNITLDGVYHSPFGANDLARPWYGTQRVLEKWVPYLLE